MNEPFAPPEAEVAPKPDSSDAGRIRTAHLRHEAGLRSLASVFFLVALGGALWSAGGIFIAVRMDARPGELLGALVAMPFVVAFGFGGALIRRHDRRVRILGPVLCAVLLLGFPIGTLLGLYGLYLLLSPKGAMILSARYLEIVKQTPQIQHRTTTAAIMTGALLAATVFGLIYWVWFTA